MSRSVELRDLGTAPASMPAPERRRPVVVPDVPNTRDLGNASVLPVVPPPRLRRPLLKEGGREQPYATKEGVVKSIREALKEKFKNLRPVSEREPETCYEILTRQNKIVENMNQLVNK